MRSRARILGVLALIALTAAAALACPAEGRAARGGGKAKIESITRHIRKDMKGVLAQARAQLRQLAQLPSVQAGNASACNSDMSARHGNPRYTALGAADLAGNVYCLSIPFTPPIVIADRAYFLRAIGTGGFSVGDFQIGRVTGQGQVGLGFPVVTGGRVNGIVLSTLALAWLGPRIAAQLRKPARDILVIDDHGTVLAHAGPMSAVQGTNIGNTALVKKALRNDRSAGATRFGGKRIFAAIDVAPLSAGAIHIAVTGRR